MNLLKECVEYTIQNNDIIPEISESIASNIEEEFTELVRKEYYKLEAVYNKINWIHQYIATIILKLDLSEEEIERLSDVNNMCSLDKLELVKLILTFNKDELITYMNRTFGNCCIQSINDL